MNTTFTYTTRIKIAVLHHLHQFNESVHTNAMEASYTADRQLPNLYDVRGKFNSHINLYDTKDKSILS